MASFDHPAWWQGLTRWLASTRIGMFVFSHTLHHLDALGLALTGGRVHVSGVLGGVPVIRLTATGYPPYAAYRRRVQNRHIPIMVLEPAP